MKKFTCSLLSIALATALTACGGGDGKKSSSSTTPTVNQNKPDTQQQTAIGRFVDAAVEGVEVFQNGKSLGKTNKMGQFEYMVNGGLLTFKIGQVTLGSTQPKPIVTPVDLTTDVNEQTEIMQVLQSLDSDQNPDNGITISEAVINNLNTPMNLTDTKVTPLDVIQKAIPNSHHVVPADAARAHFAKTQEQLKKQQANNNSANATQTLNTIVGYWVSGCENDTAKSRQHYVQVAKVNNQTVKLVQSIDKRFDKVGCTGTSKFVAREEEGEIDNIDELSVIFKDNNTLIASNEDGSYTNSDVYHRAKASDFPNRNLVQPYKDENQQVDLIPVKPNTGNNNSSTRPTGSPVTDPTEIVSRLVGTWKSQCIDISDNSEVKDSGINANSGYITFNIKKINTSQISNQRTTHIYQDSNCSGTAIASLPEDPEITDITNKDLAELVGKENPFSSDGNTLIIPDDDGSQIILYRIR